jgi:hypothetical protein
MVDRHPVRVSPAANAPQGLAAEWVMFTMPWIEAIPPQPTRIEDYVQQQYGEPLRWAITRVNEGGLAIEAVVLKQLTV